MTQSERIRLLIILIIIGLAFLSFNGEASEKLNLKLNFLPWSVHHGSTNATNERHKGIGLSITPNRFTYGIMYYENSFDDRGWMVSTSYQFRKVCTVCIGVGAGYAPTYAESGHNVYLGWLSIRHKWVTLLTAPGEVTALMLSIPID